MAYNLGNETTDTDTFPGQDGRIVASKFTSTDAGTLSGGWVYYPTTAGSGDSFKLIIYNDNGGAPGTKLEVGTATAIPASGGWVDAGSFTASIAATTDYWLGIVTNGYESFAEYYVYGSGLSMARCEDSYASPTDNPTVATTYTDAQVIAYVVVETGSPPRPIRRLVGFSYG